MKATSRKDYKWTTNSPLYRKINKRVREQRGDISCSFCPWHRKENYNWSSRNEKNWKQYRKYQSRVRLVDQDSRFSF